MEIVAGGGKHKGGQTTEILMDHSNDWQSIAFAMARDHDAFHLVTLIALAEAPLSIAS